MLVLGLDPGSNKCGYGLLDVDGASVRYVECGVLSANPRHGKWERIATIANDLRAIISEHKWGVDDVCGVEAAFVHRDHFLGADALAEARGACCYVAVAAGLTVVTVYPATVKKAVTGDGRADKQAVAAMVKQRLGLRKAPLPDAADALGVAIAVSVCK